jgi:hypothetical protein
MERLSIPLFGLDETILTQLGAKERDRFNFLSWQFLIQYLCVITGMSYFFTLLFNSYIIGIIIGLLFGTIIGSIMRFTLISIGIPLTQNVTPLNILKRWVNLIRILLYALYSLVALVPFLSLVYHNSLSVEIENYRAKIVSNYEELLQKRFENSIQDNEFEIIKDEKEIQNIEAKIEITEDLEKRNLLQFQLKKKREQYESKLKSFTLKSNQLQQSLNLEYDSYKNKIAAEDFPFFRFERLLKKGQFNFVIAMLILAFCSIILQYIRVVSGNESSYFSLCSKFYSERVIKDYQFSQAAAKADFKEKFNIDFSPILYYEDPPFNEKRIVKETEILNSSLFFEWKKNKEI